MVDDLDSLDQTDALVEQIVGDRAKLEHHANRGHTQAQAFPMEAETSTPTESNHHHDHEAASDTESDQLIGILKNFMMTAILGGRKRVLSATLPREGPLDEVEASSLTTWARGCREVQKKLRDSVTGRGYYKPESSRFKKVVRKTVIEKKPPRRDRNIRTPFRDKARDHSTERVTGAGLRKRTRCYRMSEPSAKGHSPISSQEFLFARRCLCTIA